VKFKGHYNQGSCRESVNPGAAGGEGGGLTRGKH
jgi:hypothetical protein